ncbi:MAG TPA: hypothetical protein VID27_03430, partial [Blastocatellia bacterium]
KSVLYNKSLTGEDRERVAQKFEQIGIGRPRDDGRGFWFNSDQTARLHEMLAPYLHPAVDYKLHPSLRGQFKWNPEDGDSNLDERRILRAVPAKITKIYVKPPSRSTHRFDLEIEGNHTYLVDGVVVHNSPETTTGGRALKFYSSVRLDIRRMGTIKDGENVVGSRTKVKVVKNKVAPPFKEVEVDLMYGEGISREADMLDLAVANKIVEKSGAWFSFQGERLGQGRENVKNLLKTNPEICSRIEAEVRRALGIPSPGSTSDNGNNEAAEATTSRKASGKD